MSKIYYNVKQFKNALATGLLGLATLGPMTSCEKEEHGNFNNNGIEMTYNEDEDTNDNNQEQKGDDYQVSKEDIVYGKFEGVTGNTYGYLYEDGSYRTDQKVVNKNGKFLNCFITVNDVKYRIVFNITDNGDLVYETCSPKNEETLAIFNKYRIENKYYTDRGFNPPVLPLSNDNL